MKTFAVSILDHNVRRVTISNKIFYTREEAAAYAVKLAKTRVSDSELILTGYGIKANNIEYIVVEV